MAPGRGSWGIASSVTDPKARQLARRYRVNWWTVLGAAMLLASAAVTLWVVIMLIRFAQGGL